jgi:hypothetical protein
MWRTLASTQKGNGKSALVERGVASGAAFFRAYGRTRRPSDANI